MTDDATAPSAAPSPWDRFGWLMGGIWLLFLAFPLAAILTSDLTLGLKITASALLAAFGAVYVYGFVRLNRARGSQQERWLLLAAMVLLTLALGLIIGVDALGLMAYLVAFGMFSQPLRRALWMAVGWLALTLVVLLLTGMLAARPVFLIIPVGVGVVTALIRWIDDRQDRHMAVAQELNLVAERERVAQALRDMGFRVIDSDANFVLFGTFADRHRVWQGLLDRGVLIRETGPQGHLRVSIGTREDMAAFRGALQEVTGQ